MLKYLFYEFVDKEWKLCSNNPTNLNGYFKKSVLFNNIETLYDIYAKGLSHGIHYDLSVVCTLNGDNKKINLSNKSFYWKNYCLK